MGAGEEKDWGAVLERLSRGDRVAFLEVSRLVTGYLASWRAYDFRDEWDDLVQEAVLATLQAYRSGRLREPKAAVGYLRTVARFKFVDRLRKRTDEALEPHDESAGPRGPLAWPPADSETPDPSLWARVQELPEKHQKALLLVYVEGCTYEEAAEKGGIPLGSLKRYLREGLAALRRALTEVSTDPISGAGATPSDGAEALAAPSRGGGAA